MKWRFYWKMRCGDVMIIFDKREHELRATIAPKDVFVKKYEKVVLK